MIEERYYPAGREYLLNLISDIIELQNGKHVESDTAKGHVAFSVRMYGFRHPYRFAISEEGALCRVRMETDGAAESDEHRLYQMFALLESLMVSPARVQSEAGKKL